MKRGLAILIVLVGSAHAAPRVTAPTGWAALPQRPQDVAHFGGRASVVEPVVYVAPAGGVVLDFTSVVAKANGMSASDRDVACRVEIDDLHAKTTRAALTSTTVRELGWAEHVDPKTNQIVATLSWQDTSANLMSDARLVIAADAERLVAASGACLSKADADPALIAACKAALLTLDPGIAAAARVVVGLAPVGTVPPEAAGSGPPREPAKMNDGSRAPMPPINVPQEQRTTDRRPVYVGFGIVVLAALFWWNRHRRARFEREDADE